MLVSQRISFSCSSSRDSDMMTSSVYRFSQDISCTKLLGEGFQKREELWGLGLEPWWRPTYNELFIQVATNTHSATNTHTGIFIHVLYEPHQLLNTKLAKNPSDNTSEYTNAYFRTASVMYNVFWRDGTFLVTGGQWLCDYDISGALARHEAKLHVTDAHLLS